MLAQEREQLIREKYNGDEHADLSEDETRLALGEPIAYVIGTEPFLGLTIALDSHPLIPRPETEWWTEQLIKHIGDRHLRILDLCAGSGAIGLAILKHCPFAKVFFGELEREHIETIQKNIAKNKLDATRAQTRAGDLFAPFAGETFDIIACNPPYIPSARTLPASVRAFEPAEALFSGTDGLDLIRRIAHNVQKYIQKNGELWLEADTSNIQESATLLAQTALRTEIKNDQYNRSRLVIAYY